MNILEQRLSFLQMITLRKTRLMLMNQSHTRVPNPLVDRRVQHDVLTAIEDNNEADTYMMNAALHWNHQILDDGHCVCEAKKGAITSSIA